MRRPLRLASGLVLFAYVAAHLVNHALGLVSVAAAERGLRLALALWHSLPGTVLLYVAAGLHLALAFESIYARRTLRMAPIEMWRIALGLGIPTLLIGHAVGTRLAWELYQQSPQYSRVVWALRASDGQGRQLALLVPGWLHGCLGIHIAFARRPLYQRLHPLLFSAALLLPVLGGLGFLAMGRELAADPSNRAHLDALIALPTHSGATLIGVRETLLAFYFSAIATVFSAREIRALVERRTRALVSIEYPQRTLHVPRGWSVLEASRSHQLPHLSMCGGRARCSTCRVQVTRGEDRCPPPSPAERATLARVSAGPGVRLACQLRPTGDIAVRPLLDAPHRAARIARAARTTEQEVALLCVDWHGREAALCGLLPQDAVFLSRLFREATDAVVASAGGIESDSASGRTMTLFGVGSASDISAACRDALAAARSLERTLAEHAGRWRSEFGVVAGFTLCVHAGPAAIDEFGIEASRRFTAAGAAVDALARMRALAALNGASTLVSLDVLRCAGASTGALAAMQSGRLDAGAGVQAVALPSLAGVESVLVAR
jgi:adenylate cyclase